jgi:hypothetical protein
MREVKSLFEEGVVGQQADRRTPISLLHSRSNIASSRAGCYNAAQQYSP